MQPYQFDTTRVRGLDLVSLMAAALSFAPADAGGVEYRTAERTPTAKTNPLGWLDYLGRWLWERNQRGTEVYLAHSDDIHDLERRQRALERSVPYPYY